MIIHKINALIAKIKAWHEYRRSILKPSQKCIYAEYHERMMRGEAANRAVIKLLDHIDSNKTKRVRIGTVIRIFRECGVDV